MKKIGFLFLLPFLLLAACATGPKFVASPEPTGDSALVYIYRPWSFVHGAGSPTVLLDTGHAVDLTNGGYTKIVIPAENGFFAKIEPPSTIFQQDWSGSVFIYTEPGKTYYVRWVPRVVDSFFMPSGTGYVRSKGDMRVVSESIGRREIQDTGFVALETIKKQEK